MSKEISEIGFSTIENWSVEDFYTFFHQLNILYNRLTVLDKIDSKGRAVNLKSALYGSLATIKNENRLKIKSIEIHSPGNFNLVGLDKILQQLRELIKDLSYSNKLDKKSKKEALRHQSQMNEFKEQIEQQKILANQIQIMERLGYDKEQIEVGIKAFSDPLSHLADLSEKKKISVKEP